MGTHDVVKDAKQAIARYLEGNTCQPLHQRPCVGGTGARSKARRRRSRSESGA
jgi:hypothetical protein